MLRIRVVALAVLAFALGIAPRAEVIDKAANGFTVKHVVRIAAPPAKVYDAAIAIAKWWSSAHTYSGSAANLTFEARPGGCWCEALPGGGVKHMEVVFVSPGKLVRLRGGLGPLQTTAAAGAMSWEFNPAGDATDFTLIYSVGGYAPGGLDAFATPVDGVIAEQVARLKKLAETGRAD